MSTLAKAQTYKTPQITSMLPLHKFTDFTKKKKREKEEKKKSNCHQKNKAYDFQIIGKV